MSIIGKRLKHIRETKLNNISQKELGALIGESQQTIANIETGRTLKINTEVLEKLGKVCDLMYLLYGKETNTPLSPNCVPIPFYNIGAAAGAGTNLYDIPEEDVLYFDERWLKNILGVNPKNLHLIFADGDSMDSGFNTKDDIKDRDLLMVDTSIKEGNNRIFVIMINNAELRVKKLFKKLDGTLIISSNNPKYPDEVYHPNDTKEIDVKIIGKVVWNGSKENI